MVRLHMIPRVLTHQYRLASISHILKYSVNHAVDIYYSAQLMDHMVIYWTMHVETYSLLELNI